MIDDYDLFDQDFDEFIRRGKEESGITSKINPDEMTEEEKATWLEAIRRLKEIVRKHSTH